MDVTPTKLPVIVSGSSLAKGATKIVDPLHARCLVLDDGATQIAIVVVDNLLLPRPMMDEIKQMAHKKTGIPVDRMLISATHTHTAPCVYGVLGTDRDDNYAAFLPGKIAEGIERAHKNLAPARIGWAVGKDPTNVFCRRFLMKPGTAKTNPFTGKANDQAQMNPGYQNPNAVERTGPADPNVTVLSIQTPEGRPLALVSNYSTHYAGSTPVSADYFAVFCTEIGKRIGAENLDPPFVAMLSNGTSGDANCCDFTNPRRKFDRFTVGRDVAEAAFQAYQTIEYYDWVPLVMEEARLTLNVRKPTPRRGRGGPESRRHPPQRQAAHLAGDLRPRNRHHGQVARHPRNQAPGNPHRPDGASRPSPTRSTAAPACTSRQKAPSNQPSTLHSPTATPAICRPPINTS